MSASGKVLVIMGSVRAGRHCPQIAAWVVATGGKAVSLELELVDLRDWPLPFDDEAAIPASGSYEQDHTKAWSAKVGAATGFVIVTPQYNWGYPAPLKNALDHLYREWRGKPLLLVSYGGHGGGKCAAQLRQIAEALELQAMPTTPALTLPRDVIEGAPLDVETVCAPHADAVRQAFGELETALTNMKDAA